MSVSRQAPTEAEVRGLFSHAQSRLRAPDNNYEGGWREIAELAESWLDQRHAIQAALNLRSSIDGHLLVGNLQARGILSAVAPVLPTEEKP
jgi:hypothetical protein